MSRRSLVTVLAAVVLLLPGCVTKYVTTGLTKDDVEVVVFADDRAVGDELLAWLDDHGYDNDHNHVAVLEDEDAAIRWGGSPRSYVDEIAAYVAGRYGIELEREHEFPGDDASIFIYLAGASPARVAAAPPEAGDVRVVIFTSDETKGEQFLDSLRAIGYTNTENYVTDEPNDDFNIKWGAAGPDLILDITNLAGAMFDIELDTSHVFEADDKDIFINLPFEAASPDTGRAAFEVTVFCDDDDVGRAVLADLAALGYTNEANELLAGPNEDCNIKYGGLPANLLDEVAAVVKKRTSTEARRAEEFGPTSRQVFINIPASK